MGQRICGRPAAVLTMGFLGFSPVFAMDRPAGGATETPLETGGFNSEWGLGAGPCPTRFDYVVLASFADASNLLSLSTYHFRSEVGFGSAPLTGWQRVAFKVESAGCRSRSLSPRQQMIRGRPIRGAGSPL
jgi:hypothetical protein